MTRKLCIFREKCPYCEDGCYEDIVCGVKVDYMKGKEKDRYLKKTDMVQVNGAFNNGSGRSFGIPKK